jgi:pSer/pThr/pTyr-binding forkhead associated (FHA) protein
MEVNLLLIKKNGLQKAIPLPSNVTVVGRRRDCDLRIPLPSVSRRHCQLSNLDGVLKVRDLSSRNGTIVNGVAVDEAEIKPGDVIKVGPLIFKLQINGKPDSSELARPTKQAQQPEVEISEDDLFAEFSDLDLDATLDDEELEEL